MPNSETGGREAGGLITSPTVKRVIGGIPGYVHPVYTQGGIHTLRKAPWWVYTTVNTSQKGTLVGIYHC